MKQLLFFITILFVFSSCRHISGSGNVVKENRTVSSFQGISAANGIEVEVRNGSAAVVVEADDNLMQYLVTRVENGVLRIYLDDVNVSNSHLKVFVTAPALKSIRTSSAAELELKDVFSSGENMSIRASSGSTIIALVDAPEVETKSSSGSTVTVRGKTRIHNASASSGAEIKTKELLSENSKVSASSGASVQLHASVSLDASASSGASVSYRGAANVKQKTSSGGSVSKSE